MLGSSMRTAPPQIPQDAYLMGAPDLVVEVLSPSNTVDEINDKMALCLENGCSSFWVVDPKRKRVSVTEGDVTRHYGPSAQVECAILGASFPVGELFDQLN
jgi:Uma2 family endonuclease